MNLPYRIQLLTELGDYILSSPDEWIAVKEKASYENGWFISEFVDKASNNIAEQFLHKQLLSEWTTNLPTTVANPKKVGIVMAGNIPLVGFHDFLAVVISGHCAVIKPSSKDNVLIRHLAKKLIEWEPAFEQTILFAERLNGCDAYIATGSNTTANHFEYYFRNHPHIIRKNKTSIAVLTGDESFNELEKLADDVFFYFGFGCRNVTKVYTPTGYAFESLIKAFSKYNYLADQHKYKNNYDYNLAMHILSNKYYMSTASLLLIEEKAIFSPISQLNYEFYETLPVAFKDENIQCVVGNGHTPFGNSQYPALTDYADGVNTLSFLQQL